MLVPGSNQIIAQRYRRTLAKEVSFAGIGLHTRSQVTMRLFPAPAETGIVFRRSDLPGAPLIPAHIRFVVDTSRSTTIAQGQASVTTVEHLLATISAYEIDDLWIDLNGEEPPAGNGGADTFVALFEEAGIQLAKTREGKPAIASIYTLEQPVYCSLGQSHLVVIPDTVFRFSYTLHYPKVEAIATQFLSGAVSSTYFKNELAPCRTFCLFEELRALTQRGLIKGGSLDNAVVVKGEVVFSKSGLHFADEMVRHKVLDLIGDLSLVGIPFVGHVIAICSGHKSNCMLSSNLWNYFQWRSLDVPASIG